MGGKTTYPGSDICSLVFICPLSSVVRHPSSVLTACFARDAEDAEENLLLKNREMPIFQKTLAACGGFLVFFRPLTSEALVKPAMAGGPIQLKGVGIGNCSFTN